MVAKFLKLSIVPVFFAIVFCLSVSYLTQQFGDRMLEKNKLTFAKTFYDISKLTNPLNASIDKRITATNVLLTDYNGKSEETTDPKMLAELPKGSFVLGTSTQVPVLMYHYIRYNPDPNDIVGFNLSVTPPNFSAQLDWIAQHGYHVITLDDLGANLFYHTKLPSRPIVLTFDDGYRDFYTDAFPILKKHNMIGINFIITGFVELPRYLTWAQIIEMKNSGYASFESHTVNHPALSYLSDTSVLQELIQSKRDLESHLGYPINWLAYPFGNVNERVANLAKKAGYLGAFGTQLGTFQSTDILYTEPRVRVGGGDSPQSLGSRLPWQ